jgi:hypothetical protein
MSVKLPHKAILDFDIDRNCYYALIVSSEGDAHIYDIEKAQENDELVTNQRLRLSSRETVSYHKELKFVDEERLKEELKTYSAYIPEEGITN